MFERASARQFLTTSTAKDINWEAIASQLTPYEENCNWDLLFNKVPIASRKLIAVGLRCAPPNLRLTKLKQHFPNCKSKVNSCWVALRSTQPTIDYD